MPLEALRPFVGHALVLLTVLLTIYGQVVVKWQLLQAGIPPAGGIDKVVFILKLLLNPWVLSGFVGAFLASLCWMGALTRFPLSVAYPFMSLAFVGVILCSAMFFAEPLSLSKMFGMMLLIAGIVTISQNW